MGSFWGHIDEGLFFIVLSLWWMVNGFRELVLAGGRAESITPRVSYSIFCRREIPIETIMKILFLCVGIGGELFDGGAYFIDQDGNFRKLVYMQHLTIYGLFMLHSIIDLLVFFRFPIIDGVPHVSAALAFFWYGVAFYFHSQMHGKEPLEEAVHVVPITAMVGAGLAMMYEHRWRRGIWTLLVRSYFVLTLGTWFSHVAFMLYVHDRFPGGEPSNWDRSDPRNVAFAHAAFGFHLMFNLVFMCVLYAVIYFILRCRHGSKVKVSHGYDYYYAYSAVSSLDRGDVELDKPLLNGHDSL